jgi:hypothetical protein
MSEKTADVHWQLLTYKTANAHQHFDDKKENRKTGFVKGTQEYGWTTCGTWSELLRTAGQCPHECAQPKGSSGRPP